MANTYYSVPESCSRPRPLSDTQHVSRRDSEITPNNQHNAEAQGVSNDPAHASEPRKALHAPAEVFHTSPPAPGSAESATEGAAFSAPPRALAAQACHEHLP
ncbi:hypothetical protein LTR53_017930, partial [Teratosphaeriaceae sp. CCFEE 6253]